MTNRNLIIGAIAGAAVGAAASYLMDNKDRTNLVSGIKDLGTKAMDMLGNVPGLAGFAAEDNATGSSAQASSRRKAPSRG